MALDNVASKRDRDEFLTPIKFFLNPHLAFAVADSGCTVETGPHGSIRHCGRSPDMFAHHKGGKLSLESLAESCRFCRAVFLSFGPPSSLVSIYHCDYET